MARTKRSFTLIELMVVIGIIAILASLAIPNMFEARKAANEVAAIGSLKTIMSTEALFREGDADGEERIGHRPKSSLTEEGTARWREGGSAAGRGVLAVRGRLGLGD